VVNQLAVVGQLLRQHRKLFKITANATGETPGISRVTVHRIEKGDPTVSMGAYLNVISALDLKFHLSKKDDAACDSNRGRLGQFPVRILLDDCPQLKEFAWHVQGVVELSPVEVHSVYERNKRFLDRENLSDSEQELIELLGLVFEGGQCLDFYSYTSPTNSKST
jgi:DNA-binding XRE family transcriptional regulator